MSLVLRASSTSAGSRYRKAGNDVAPGRDADHTHELQLGGVDDLTNMKDLDSSVNRSIGSQIQHQLKGAPIGSLGQEFGDNPDDQSVGTYLSSGGLESELGKQFVDESGGSVIPEQLDEAIKEGFDEARQNLARAHIEAVDNDKRGTENFLSAGQITDYHHDVFGSMGLPRNTFGGTMVTGTKLEGKISGALVWCKSCDKE